MSAEQWAVGGTRRSRWRSIVLVRSWASSCHPRSARPTRSEGHSSWATARASSRCRPRRSMTCSALRDFFISTEGLAQTSRSRTTSKEEIWARFSRRATVECIIKHVRREERPELSEEALWEAVSNAVAHREYRSTASVQIYAFEDRIEVVSLGGLPAGMTEADLGGKRVPGNPLLFGMLYRVDAVENIGSGIRRIRDLCREHGGAEPTFDVFEHWVTVFPRSAAPVDDQRVRQAGSAAERRPESGPESGLAARGTRLSAA